MTKVPQPSRVPPQQSQAWLHAAFVGDMVGLKESFATDFWSTWHSNRGTPPLHVVVSQGKVPSVLPILLGAGAQLTPCTSAGKPLAHQLDNRPAECILAWVDALAPHGVDWEAVYRERTLLQRCIERGDPALVDALLDRGLQLPEQPHPVVLAMYPLHARKSPEMLTWLRERQPDRPSVCPELFYIHALRSGLPCDWLPWCESWGLPLTPTPAVLAAATDVIYNTHPLSTWVEELVYRGAEASWEHEGLSAHQRAHQYDHDYNAENNPFDQAMTAGLRRRLSESLESAEMQPRPRSARL